MLISELIAKLEEFKKENGDIETAIRGNYDGGYFPFDVSIEIDEDADEDNNKVVVFD